MNDKRNPERLAAQSLNQRAHAEGGEVAVYGLIDRRFVQEIDRVADQMLMPRSWVVSQIVREWVERRTSECGELEQSWNDSYREVIGRLGLEDCPEESALRRPATA